MADAVSTPPPAAVGDASTPKDGSIDAIAHGVCKKLLEDLARDQHFAPYFETPIDLALYPDYRDHVDRPICYSDIRQLLGPDAASCQYPSVDAFVKDLRLLFENATKYCSVKRFTNVYDYARGILGQQKYTLGRIMQEIKKKSAPVRERSSAMLKELISLAPSSSSSLDLAIPRRKVSTVPIASPSRPAKTLDDDNSMKPPQSSAGKGRRAPETSPVASLPPPSPVHTAAAVKPERSPITSSARHHSYTDFDDPFASIDVLASPTDLSLPAFDPVSVPVTAPAPAPTEKVSPPRSATTAPEADPLGHTGPGKQQTAKGKDKAAKEPVVKPAKPPKVKREVIVPDDTPAVSMKEPELRPFCEKSLKMTDDRKRSCQDLVATLKSNEGARFSIDPEDYKSVAGYTKLIDHPVALNEISDRLQRKVYATVGEFVRDVSLVFTNGVAFNYHSPDLYRPMIKCLEIFQKACDHKLHEARIPKWKNSFPEVSSFATVVEELMKKHPNEVYPFLYPVKNYFADPTAIGNYADVIKRPMCLQTVCERLYTGQYMSARQLIGDVVRVFDNAILYAAETEAPQDDGIVKNAHMLRALFIKHSKQIVDSAVISDFDVSKRAAAPVPAPVSADVSDELPATAAKPRPTSSTIIDDDDHEDAPVVPKEKKAKKRERDEGGEAKKRKGNTDGDKRPKLDSKSWQGLCSQVLEALRYVEYHTVDNSVINAAEAFQDPVDPVAFPDYHQIVINPVDFSTIRKTLHSGRYASPDDFQTDVKLVFDNCFTYNKGPYFIEDNILKLCNATKRKFYEEWARLKDKIEAAYRHSGKSSKAVPPPAAPVPASPFLPIAPPSAQPVGQVMAPPKTKKTKEGGEKVKKDKKKDKHRDGEHVSKKSKCAAVDSEPQATPSPPTGPPSSTLPQPPLMITQRQISEAGEITPSVMPQTDEAVPTSPIAIPRFTRPTLPPKKRVREEEPSPDDNLPLSALVGESGDKPAAVDDDEPEFDASAEAVKHEIASVPSFKLSLPAERPVVAVSAAPQPSTPARVKLEGFAGKSSRNAGVEDPWWKASARRVLEAMLLHEYKRHFDRPVIEMFPGIAESYLAVIKKPMDFSTIDHKLNSGRYSYLSQVAADIHLVFDNAILYNKDAEDGLDREVRLKAEHLRKHVDVLFDEIALSYPGSEPVDVPSSEAVPPVPFGVSVESQNSLPMPPLVYASVLHRRTQRNNTLADYRFDKKSLGFAKDLIKRLMNKKRYGSINFPFTAPVSEVYPAIPADYDSIVSRRMDLRTVKETLDREGYAVPKDFLADVKLVFDNALLYNKNLKGMPNGEYELAAAMMRAFEREWGELSVHALEHFERMDANKNILAPKIAERIAVSTKVNEVTLKATQDINAIYSDQVTREADARKHAKAVASHFTKSFITASMRAQREVQRVKAIKEAEERDRVMRAADEATVLGVAALIAVFRAPEPTPTLPHPLPFGITDGITVPVELLNVDPPAVPSDDSIVSPIEGSDKGDDVDMSPPAQTVSPVPVSLAKAASLLPVQSAVTTASAPNAAMPKFSQAFIDRAKQHVAMSAARKFPKFKQYVEPAASMRLPPVVTAPTAALKPAGPWTLPLKFDHNGDLPESENLLPPLQFLDGDLRAFIDSTSTLSALHLTNNGTIGVFKCVRTYISDAFAETVEHHIATHRCNVEHIRFVVTHAQPLEGGPVLDPMPAPTTPLPPKEPVSTSRRTTRARSTAGGDDTSVNRDDAELLLGLALSPSTPTTSGSASMLPRPSQLQLRLQPISEFPPLLAVPSSQAPDGMLNTAVTLSKSENHVSSSGGQGAVVQHVWFSKLRDAVQEAHRLQSHPLKLLRHPMTQQFAKIYPAFRDVLSMEWNSQLSCYIRVAPSNRYQRSLAGCVHDIVVTSFDILCLQSSVVATIDDVTVHDAVPCLASLPDSSHKILAEFLAQKAREGGFAALNSRMPSLPVTAGSVGVGSSPAPTNQTQGVAAQQRRAAQKATRGKAK